MSNDPSGSPASTATGTQANTAQRADDTGRQIKRGSIMLARAVSYLVYAYTLVVEVILVLGFTLLLFGANPSSSFVEWAYRNLERAMRPFRGIFAPVEIGVAGNDVPAIFDTSILFAMIIYAIVAIAVSGLITWLTVRINKLDRDAAFEASREQHRRELQALHDRATIVDAQRAAASGASPEWIAAQRAADEVSAAEWEAARRAGPGYNAPPRAPGT